ncbi:hypothetical protein ACIRVF_16320 [Kitasatospora sp. NPDC101157]|uniref:hypothetical protein n=1 Tax=Kitasatospora sp. NPDC101157 TaxID=3364098 RepID=UPI0037FD4145
MRERTVTIYSAGETFSFTGWTVGWVKRQALFAYLFAGELRADAVAPAETPGQSASAPMPWLKAESSIG